MEKIIASLEAAIAKEARKTPALAVMSAYVQSLKERLAEHYRSTDPQPQPEMPKA